LNAKVDAEVDSLYVKRIGIDDLVGYVYRVRLDITIAFFISFGQNLDIITIIVL
jgi:hypothetical protein